MTDLCTRFHGAVKRLGQSVEFVSPKSTPLNVTLTPLLTDPSPALPGGRPGSALRPGTPLQADLSPEGPQTAPQGAAEASHDLTLLHCLLARNGNAFSVEINFEHLHTHDIAYRNDFAGFLDERVSEL